MLWRPCFTAFLASISQHAALVRAAPALAFPVNSQIPPVAFGSRAYSFTFSPTTFKSDRPEISYSLGNAPAWLSLDSTRRTLQGTPTAADVGPVTFELNAQDEDGQTPSSVTLMVVRNVNIRAGQSLLPFLRVAGSVSAQAILLLKPLEAFEIRLSPDAFTGASSSTAYYAVVSMSQNLCQFDLTFLHGDLKLCLR